MDAVISNQEELENILKKDILQTKKNIKIFAGHLPMVYETNDQSERTACLDVNRWGDFSCQTFELGTQLIQFARSKNKLAKLIVVVDDDVELLKVEKMEKLVRKDENWHKKPRRKIFKNSTLPLAYTQIMQSYNLTNDSLIRQNRTNFSSLLISEKVLKSDAEKNGVVSANECSLAYKGLIFDDQYFNPNEDYLISLMPGQCKGNICSGLLNTSIAIDSSHIFYPHIELMGGIVETNEGYKKLAECLNLSTAFRKGLITYRKDHIIE
ncbi:MAG: hypothetical protein ACI8ZM_003829 [Crocinitomix sp.]|jgi:hypothetical protein